MEARRRDQGGEHLVEANATRGSASELSGKTGLGGTDPQDAHILEAATAAGSHERKRRRYRNR